MNTGSAAQEESCVQTSLYPTILVYHEMGIF